MSDEGSIAASSRLLACQQCSKSFTRPENLARHMKTHDTVRKHCCQVCGRQFTRSDLRRKHELLHGRATPSRVASKSRRASITASNRNDTSPLHMQSGTSVPPYYGDPSVVISVDGGEVNATMEAQSLAASLDADPVNIPWAEQVDFDPYFDYTTFARPWNYQSSQTVESSDWFSSQFFAALRETDLAYSPPIETWSNNNYAPTNTNNLGTLGYHDGISSAYLLKEGIDLPSGGELSRSTAPDSHIDADLEGPSGQTSRGSSPPNESSREDRHPFAWNPRSKPITKAKPIVLAANDPIFASIDENVRITQVTLSQVQHFLRPRQQSGSEDSFTLPALSLVNVFISLFFNKFLPQAPVLHRSTLRIETLPPSLLSIIMVVGSCYSRLRHTRRFGIIVLDRTRQNLLAMIEQDNSLMREPSIIYAVALACYMGLWCGNKRAFELSEALRAVAVTYIRRLPDIHDRQEHDLYHAQSNNADGETYSATSSRSPSTLESQWLDWVSKERRKRLRWFVYMMDSQFPAILGMSSMLTTADIRRWECPCDEDFWNVATARSWKHRLGSASEPACSVFGPLVASVYSTSGPAIQQAVVAILPSLNSWSASLLLTAIMAEVYHYQDMLVVLRTYDEEYALSEGSSREDFRAVRLIAMLEAWSCSYQQLQPPRRDATSAHLCRCSTIMYHLARVYLYFPVSDIQDCLGRSGLTSAKAAMSRLKSWIAQYPEKASHVMEDASHCISIVMSNQGESDPYDIIGLFLCHVIIWSFAHVASAPQKESTLRLLRANSAISGSVLDVIEAGFASNNSEATNGVDAPQLIFRHAIQALVQLGDWGASSNLALLLHLHPGISMS
ncbi:fungal-specific transcription factor domain-containing protein [Boeremia exigua]|uniref:fungal-specific transcription factor domain-containing protein n=1 Tax=Boeremia exigua TaxID=749465 RepID=UPI001E8D2F03|nr:fungal-specific transcription factor domain-containing protein [Boeremia exigua]KAH6629330.1 fungal-specific transcription factor domain-containing protein [Boeremia exigua]